ncbi:MAG: ATP-binding cassette domain-containing protein [Micromonosporaceae bacterium]|nr:ATP-binding cassette domain-containing protein [Micromonosporaceae bacterium]
MQPDIEQTPLGEAVTGGPAAIALRRLTQTFRSPKGESFDAIADIDLDVADGEFVAIVGPSGCGKSTLLNIVSGILPPTRGEVSVKDIPVTGVRDDIGYMPARDLLLPWRTVEHNVEFPLEIQRRLSPAERRQRAHELLAAVGLSGFERYYPHALSQGMKQRVAIARTFATRPDVLLMDEPFSALDAQTRVVVQDLFLTIWEAEHRTVVLITHDVTEAVALADRVVVMSPRPGTIRSVYDIALPRPRSVEQLLFEEPRYQRYLQRIWRDLQH